MASVRLFVPASDLNLPPLKDADTFKICASLGKEAPLSAWLLYFTSLAPHPHEDDCLCLCSGHVVGYPGAPHNAALWAGEGCSLSCTLLFAALPVESDTARTGRESCLPHRGFSTHTARKGFLSSNHVISERAAETA